MGLDLLKHPKQKHAVLRAIEGRQTILDGPIELVQGGRALITRTPIFLGPNQSEYWGLGTVLIDSDSFLERTARQTESLRLTIVGSDLGGTGGQAFFGKSTIYDLEPVTRDIFVPGGKWQLAAIPAGGWAKGPANATAKRGLGIFIVLAAAWMVGALLSANLRLRDRTAELQAALGEVRTLRGMLPVCSNCKSVRDDQGLWNRVERYIEALGEVQVTHSICPTCLVELYGEEMAARVLAAEDDPTS